MQASTFTLATPDGVSLFVYRWLPDGPPKAVVQIAKTIAVREMLRTHTYVKKMLWGGKFCTATLAWGEHRRATWQ